MNPADETQGIFWSLFCLFNFDEDKIPEIVYSPLHSVVKQHSTQGVTIRTRPHCWGESREWWGLGLRLGQGQQVAQ